MKYLKKFNETDSWVGSLYAYKNPLVPSMKNLDFELPKKATKEHKCANCGIIYYTIDGDEIKCNNCGSSELTEDI